MKIWRLTSGILSIAISGIVLFQSVAAGLADALGGTDTGAMAAGVLVAVLMIAGGIVSIVSRKDVKKGANIAMIIMFSVAAVIGYTMHGVYQDLIIWATWCVACVAVAVISARKNK